MRVALLFCFIGACLASQAEHDPFIGFAQQFNKEYLTKAEISHRRSVFMDNLKKMELHNQKYAKGEVSWFKKVHPDMDLTTEEWMAKRASGLPEYDNTTVFQNTHSQEVLNKMAKLPKNLPRDFSWVDSGAVSSVKNQAGCGSCAAFATIGGIESCYFMATGAMYDDLSEQHILDCAYNHYYNDDSGSWGAFGCDGAWPQAYVDWLVSHSSWNQIESSYPYTSGSSLQVTACNPDNGGYNTNAWVTGMHNQWYTNENDMINLLQQGPVVVSIQVTDNWGGYGGGVLDDNACCNQNSDPDCRFNLNHAVLVVGYGNEGGMDYWLIKNSWGTRWGDSGFFKIKRGTGHCGVGCLHQTVVTCAKA